jgi:hypothetical protein
MTLTHVSAYILGMAWYFGCLVIANIKYKWYSVDHNGNIIRPNGRNEFDLPFKIFWVSASCIFWPVTMFVLIVTFALFHFVNISGMLAEKFIKSILPRK